MPKRKLEWHKINVATSKGLDKLVEAERKAQEATNNWIKAKVAKAQGVPEAHVRIGRMYGQISYAIDDQASPTETVSL